MAVERCQVAGDRIERSHEAIALASCGFQDHLGTIFRQSFEHWEQGFPQSLEPLFERSARGGSPVEDHASSADPLSPAEVPPEHLHGVPPDAVLRGAEVDEVGPVDEDGLLALLDHGAELPVMLFSAQGHLAGGGAVEEDLEGLEAQLVCDLDGWPEISASGKMSSELR